MSITLVLWLGAGLIICAFAYMFYPLRRPLPTESDYSHHTPVFWQLYYSSKYGCGIKRAEKGSGLEAYFRDIQAPQDSSIPLRQSRTITIKAAGDLMFRRDLASPSSPHLWDEVGEYMFTGDIIMGNLEFAVNPDTIIQKLLRYSISPAQAEPLLGDRRFGKFHLVSLGNNHINDSLSAGIVSTNRYLDSAGVLHVGANRTPEEADAFPIMEAGGIKIAFLSYTFSTNNIPLDKDFQHGVNLVRFNALNDSDYDPSIIMRHIRLAKERGADIIVSSHHWGIEFENYPPLRIVRRAHELLDAGIDVIVGHHPHTLNPAEWYTARDGRKTLCLYSIGNITAYALIRPWQRMSLIAAIAVETGFDEKGVKITRLKDVSLMPAFFHLKGRGANADHRIVPVLSAAAAIRQGNRPPYLNGWDGLVVTMLQRSFKKHLWQEQAFRYI